MNEYGEQSAQQLLADIEDALGPLYEKWLQGNWGPADEEVLFSLINDDLHDDLHFAWDSVPSNDALCRGCDRYQFARSVKIHPPADLSTEEKLIHYWRCIRAIADRRGQDVCWEVDDLFQQLPQYRLQNDPHGASLAIRLTFCERYRAALDTRRPGSKDS